MPDTTYTTLKTKILTKLQGISKIQEVTDNPKLSFSGYPAAVIIPSDQDSDYETTTENARTYTFIVSLFQETKDSGISAAIDTLYDLVDDILDNFDTDQQLSGISLPADYTMLAVRPVSGGWAQIDDHKLITVDLKIRCLISVDIS